MAGTRPKLFLRVLTRLSVIALATGAALSATSPPSFALARVWLQVDPQNLEDVEAFVDGFMAAHMDRLHVPGAAVVVVKDGEVLVEKGYGLSNLDTRTPVTPDTQFRAKSVSKTFAATAVMQLVEQGEVDLHADVASYLPGEAPITLHQLLTHTSGISDRGIGTMSRDREEAADLRGYLADRMASRLYPPGSTFSYTDHGISLAGLVVEEVSGLPFARYAQDRILGPLGMDDSAFDPPLEGRPDLAVGYQLVNGGFRPGPVGYFRVAPAVSLVTSVHDMGQFLVAMLEGGSAGEGTILRPGTVRLMQARHYAPHPDGTGVAYGLFQWPQNGERVLVHGGSGHGYGSLLVLLPERRVGLFVATNTDQSALRGALFRAFMDRFYPTQQFILLPGGPPPESTLERFAGVYREYRYDGGRQELLGEVFGQEDVAVNGDGTLSFSWTEGRWTEQAPLLFRNVDDPDELVTFESDADGEITRVFLPPDSGLVKVPWYGTMQAFLTGWVAFSLLFLSSAVVWLAAALRRRTSGARWSGRARAVAGVMGVLNVAFLAGVPLLILPYSGLDGSELDFGLPLRFRLVLAIPLVTTALAVALAVAAVQVWRKRAWGRAARIHFTAVAVGSVLFPGFLSYWKLFGLGA
jgi:CubicO group peptidase (beta-lactamase class C family)